LITHGNILAMRIHFINPAHVDGTGKPVRLTREFTPGLTLAYLAALVPPGHQVTITDETVQPLDFNEPFDLVGITAMTYRAPRAYAIADEYRRRGVAVIMGGFHASALPDEALTHCDAVVKGEAEGLLEEIINDLSNGRLKTIYQRQERHNLKGLPVPRYDLIPKERYLMVFYPVQATRGCPHGCEFCSVAAFYGRKHRKRPVTDVITDMKNAGRFILIVDDNLTVDRAYAMELFAAMKPLKKLWCAQIDLSAARDETLIRAAADAGCIFLYVGIETLNIASMIAVGKTTNLGFSVETAIATIKRHHIDILASMMIGLDEDRPETAEQLIAFCLQQRIPVAFFYIMTPIPGSPLYRRLEKEGVPFDRSWHLYDGTHSVFSTKHITSDTLETLYHHIYSRVYSIPGILRRTLLPPHLLIIAMNWVIRQNLKDNRHSWEGFNRSTLIPKILPVTVNLFTHPLLRKLSRIARYFEGRTIFHQPRQPRSERDKTR